MTPAQPNNSLIKGIACLQLVVSSDKPLGVREIARELELNPTRVNRLLSTLAHLGLVEQDAKRKYRSGTAIHVLAAQSLHASPILSLALPHLMEFRRGGFTVALGVLWRRKVCYLFHERPWQHLEDSLGRHEVFPAEHSSLGMVLLAHQNAPPPSPDLPSGGVTDDNSNWAEALASICAEGYAVRHYKDGEISIAAPIGSPPVAAIGISGQHIGETYIPEVAGRLLQAAAEISRGLGK